MTQATRVAIPTLVRIKPDALARVGVYLSRLEHRRVAVFLSDGLIEPLAAGLRTSASIMVSLNLWPWPGL